ncbi:MAG: hypothetical protein FWF77_00450 [Defluviitaleaceae bacterium]|nr:hypothetical protein [Defluviitaleaceae bacterium]
MLKKIFAVLIFAVIAAIFPVGLHAAQTTRTLQPGNVYEFSGTDARVVSHVNVSGGRYEIVLRDADDEVTRFGRASGRFSVSGTGAAEVSPIVPINVTFDSTRISLTSREGRAFRQFEVWAGEGALRLENSTNEPLQIRLGGVAGFVVYNRVGDVVDFALGDHEEPLPMLTIPARGRIDLESDCDSSLAVYFPARWYGEEILAEFTDVSAIERIFLTANQPRTITAEENLTLSLVGAYADTPLSYEYVVRGRDGHVIRYGEGEGNELQIAARQTITLTPLESGQIYFPRAWIALLDDLHGENGAAAPVYLPLRPRSSIEISNDDPLRAHTIFVRCAEETGEEFGYEYVMFYDDEISFNVFDDVLTPQASIVIPAGAVVILTATHASENLAIGIPDVPAITTRNVTASALIRRTLGEGESIFVSNEGDDDAKILIQTEETVDYVRYDEDGEIISFGRAGDEYILIEETHSVLLTATDDSAVLIFPREPLLVLEESENAALVRRVISSSDILQINNSDRWYNRALLVQNENERDGEFDFIITNAQNAVLEYGAVEAGRYVLPNSGRIILAPRRGAEFSIAFPAEFARHFRIREAAEQPLHRVTLTPGNSLTLFNRTDYVFAITNNSRAGGAGFHAFGEGEWVRRFDPEWEQYFYEFVPPRPVNIERDTPERGSIELPANSRLEITAALGEDLEILMPRTWARQLGLIR